MSYFNTTNISDPELAEYQLKSATQQQTILESMKIAGRATASGLHRHMNHYPITSIRRALTCLAKEGYLIKTPNKIIGPWGRPEYVYKFID